MLQQVDDGMCWHSSIRGNPRFTKPESKAVTLSAGCAHPRFQRRPSGTAKAESLSFQATLPRCRLSKRLAAGIASFVAGYRRRRKPGSVQMEKEELSMREGGGRRVEGGDGGQVRGLASF
jgi:hypothetical protein